MIHKWIDTPLRVGDEANGGAPSESDSSSKSDSSTKSTSAQDTGSVFASQSGQGKSSGSQSRATNSTSNGSTINPGVVGVGGQGIPVSKSGDGIIVHDGIPSQAQPVGGNLYRAGDGRTWSLDGSGLTAHSVMAPPGPGSGHSGGGGEIDWDFGGGGGGLGTLIGILWLGLPFVIVIFGICYVILVLIGFVLVTFLGALLSALLIAIVIAGETILLFYYSAFRQRLDKLCSPKLLKFFYATFYASLVCAVFTGAILVNIERQSRSADPQKYLFDSDDTPKLRTHQREMFTTDDSDLRFVGAGVRSNWIPSMCSAYLYDDQFGTAQNWALYRTKDSPGFNAIGYNKDGSMAMWLNFDGQRKLGDYFFISPYDRYSRIIRVTRRDHDGKRVTSTDYRFDAVNGALRIVSACSAISSGESSVLRIHYGPTGTPEFTLLVQDTDRRLIKRLSWSDKPDVDELNSYFDLFGSLATKYFPTLQHK